MALRNNHRHQSSGSSLAGRKGTLYAVLREDETRARRRQRRGHAEGFAQGRVVELTETILEMLEAHGEIPESLRSRIMSIKDNSSLSAHSYQAVPDEVSFFVQRNPD